MNTGTRDAWPFLTPAQKQTWIDAEHAAITEDYRSNRTANALESDIPGFSRQKCLW
jgi:hypothetical protein